MDEKKTPVKSFKSGLVEIAVWRNEKKGGGTFLNATISNQYKDEAGDYHETKSWSAGDLFSLIRCATDAAAFLFFENVRELKKAA